MGTTDTDKLLVSLSKLPGVTAAEVEGWMIDKYGVRSEFLPERIKDG
jgi:hypothetical protein